MSDQAKVNQTPDRANPAVINSLANVPLTDSQIVARNDFGRKLMEIRNRAIQKGMRLKSLDEVLAGIAEGRKEL